LGEEERGVGMGDDTKIEIGAQVGDIRTLQKNSKALSRLYEHLQGIRLLPKLNQWLRQYDEQQMTDNNMITIDDIT
jgi:hypothetical protein